MYPLGTYTFDKQGKSTLDFLPPPPPPDLHRFLKSSRVPPGKRERGWGTADGGASGLISRNSDW